MEALNYPFRSIRRTKIREQGEEAKKTDMASEKMISDNAFKDSVRTVMSGGSCPVSYSTTVKAVHGRNCTNLTQT